MPVPLQQSMFGEARLVPADVPAGIRLILEEHPSARNDYRELVARYWLAFDGLDRVLGDRAEAFLAWICQKGTTSPKTIQNRCLELQRQERTLDAAPAVRRVRNAQATQGVVR